MKKFLIIVACILSAVLLLDYLYFYEGVLYRPDTGEVEYGSKAEGERLWIDRGSGFEAFEIKGVNLGLGKPGYFATEYAITKEEYLRWFQQIKDMGANVIRVYILAHEDFYNAFYEFNQNNPDPLYLIHGVWVDDYLINSSYSALDEEFYEPFIEDCKAVVDAIHGRYKSRSGDTFFPQSYDKDISPWVYGYILGIEWEPTLVSYTDNSFEQLSQFEGEYFYTEDASNFEIFLASVGESVVAYETEKYGQQRVLAFANWATTDPLEYPAEVLEYFKKAAFVDVERIKCSEKFMPGQFASYHIYPYYPDYYSMIEGHEENTYLQYLTAINEHHTMPVVISEFGVPSARGMAAVEESYGRNQGFMSEDEQGLALISMYEDITQAGSAGAIVFTWQDEWFKRTWNTMSNVDLDVTAYWSDYQTNEQYFGLLSFDPGKEESVCYVDGVKAEWTPDDRVAEQDGCRISMKYDEKFIYFMVEKEGLDIETDKLYIPIDTTPKSGSEKAENLGISMSEAADFVIELNGSQESRVWVQEYYDSAYALYYELVSPENIFSKTFPERDSETFNEIVLLLQKDLYFEAQSLETKGSATDRALEFYEFDTENPFHYSVLMKYETGKLLYGNANPSAEEFNSLADFCASDGFVEIKLPWQLLNFADPVNMEIHDDYYECYGVEYLQINSMNVGAGDGSKTIEMAPFALEELGRKPEYHERLKESYYILQEYWMKGN